MAGAVQVLLPEHQAAALHGARVELQAEDDVAGGRAVLLVVALHLGRGTQAADSPPPSACSPSSLHLRQHGARTGRSRRPGLCGGNRARGAGAQVTPGCPQGTPVRNAQVSVLDGHPGHADAPQAVSWKTCSTWNPWPLFPQHQQTLVRKRFCHLNSPCSHRRSRWSLPCVMCSMCMCMHGLRLERDGGGTGRERERKAGGRRGAERGSEGEEGGGRSVRFVRLKVRNGWYTRLWGSMHTLQPCSLPATGDRPCSG